MEGRPVISALREAGRRLGHVSEGSEVGCQLSDPVDEASADRTRLEEIPRLPCSLFQQLAASVVWDGVLGVEFPWFTSRPGLAAAHGRTRVRVSFRTTSGTPHRPELRVAARGLVVGWEGLVRSARRSHHCSVTAGPAHGLELV